ncbi:MAG: ABC transporter permease [Oscillospiraceae bacterium]|nr:ABC transporter permease [Oscillospiraceae bacterium]
MRRNRISFFRELSLLIREGFWIMVNDTKNILISLMFPLVAAFITVWIAGKDMYYDFESTQAACFIIVCAAIWGGLFNSIQSVVKERDIVKREFTSGALRLECYIFSRAILQLMLCVVQSIALCLSFYGVALVHNHNLPASGVIFGSSMVEYYISVLLIMYASDMLGLTISCFVRTEQLASQISPYILIAQLLFSGLLFPMEGLSSSISAFMFSRWGMEALGTISDINSLDLFVPYGDGYMIPHDPVDYFTYTPEHLMEVWMILIVFCVGLMIIGNIALYSVKKDSR